MVAYSYAISYNYKKVDNWPTQRPMRRRHICNITPNLAGRDGIGVANDTVEKPDHTFTKSDEIETLTCSIKHHNATQELMR